MPATWVFLFDYTSMCYDGVYCVFGCTIVFLYAIIHAYINWLTTCII